MTVDAISLHAKSDWQNKYESGYEEGRSDNPCPLDRFDQLTQDSMARALLHRELSELHWAILSAKYSLNYMEVDAAIRYLIPRAESPAHRLFITKAVFAWAVPKQRRRVKESFYQLHTWDTDGTPESTLRRWRGQTNRWLENTLTEAYKRAGLLLDDAGMIFKEAA
ncbi:hypothetical protein EAW52_10790 [Pseudomonas sp. LTJR-52]|uniref:hypothetical protein n=1 Tax=Pseudomonas sp. LTJR-52 TaxID=2479392 RepID=UPI000EFB0917|nr:hypothetical protein [Pseudomonas sp. LTJR-52]AYN94410.1 hypothetical protein EAW52_10790 [Pseudomonas sp. LTJR-52]